MKVSDGCLKFAFVESGIRVLVSCYFKSQVKTPPSDTSVALLVWGVIENWDTKWIPLNEHAHRFGHGSLPTGRVHGILTCTWSIVLVSRGVGKGAKNMWILFALKNVHFLRGPGSTTHSWACLSCGRRT